jgi:hypothetical protein
MFTTSHGPLSKVSMSVPMTAYNDNIDLLVIEELVRLTIMSNVRIVRLTVLSLG